MAWTRIPAEHYPLFLAALPKDPRISTLKMFGSIVALVRGNMFGGLFARSIMAKLGAADQQEALALDGSEPFDPMGTGRVMTNTVLLAEEVMDDPQVLRDWLRRAFEHALTLPPKPAKTKPAAGARAKAKAKPAPATRAKAKPAPATRAKAKPAPAARAKAKPARRRSTAR